MLPLRGIEPRALRLQNVCSKPTELKGRLRRYNTLEVHDCSRPKWAHTHPNVYLAPSLDHIGAKNYYAYPKQDGNFPRSTQWGFRNSPSAY